MPLYEYECELCGHRFEVIQKFSDAPIEVCAKCGGVVRKLLSSPAIQFKGSGWYITDYARAGKSEASTPESGAAAKGDDSKSVSAESKSEARTESKSESTSESKSASKSESKSDAKPSSSAPSTA